MKKMSPKVAADPPKPARRRNRLLALEPRYLFDGVALTDAPHDPLHPDAAQAPVEAARAGVQVRDTTAADTPAAVGAPAAGGVGGEILFIDAAVQDYSTIVAAVRPGVQVVVLDPTRDGLQQISEALNGRIGVDAIYIVSHGSAGDIRLAASDLNAGVLQSRAAELSAWQTSLSAGADILVYGCDVAAGEAGSALITSLARLTAADVAASTDPTGAANLGGDWTLELLTLTEN
ncbi:MAG: DUF4347 domain-containing protein [Rhodocyclales bacterium]|nr:DUF4347 domain-containing protein [Rhodocyclales bacterium]